MGERAALVVGHGRSDHAHRASRRQAVERSAEKAKDLAGREDIEKMGKEDTVVSRGQLQVPQISAHGVEPPLRPLARESLLRLLRHGGIVEHGDVDAGVPGGDGQGQLTAVAADVEDPAAPGERRARRDQIPVHPGVRLHRPLERVPDSRALPERFIEALGPLAEEPVEPDGLAPTHRLRQVEHGRVDHLGEVIEDPPERAILRRAGEEAREDGIVVIAFLDALHEPHGDKAEEQDPRRVGPEPEPLGDLPGREARALVEQGEEPDVMGGPEDGEAHGPAERREQAVFAGREPA